MAKRQRQQGNQLMNDTVDARDKNPTTTEAGPSPDTEGKQQQSDPPPDSSVHGVGTGLSVVLMLIVTSLVWYLFADRYTPYTAQARLQGYVVGVAPKVAGLVTQVWVDNNTEVAQDQPLFEIDPSQYEIALQRAESDLQNAQNQVDAGSAAVDKARANLRAALANELKAEQDYSRLKRLHESDPGTISVRRLEISSASLEQASAKVVAAQADIERAIEQKGGDDDQNNAMLKSARSAVEKARLDLSNTVVKAATRGVITDLRAEVGQYAGTGTPVMTLVAVQDVWIEAQFTENNLGNLRPGSDVEIVFDVLPGQVFEGRIGSIGLGVSASQAPPPGTLPTVSNNRDWLRQAQRFPVVVVFDIAQDPALRSQLRIGGQAAVIAYAGDTSVLRWLGGLYVRLMSWLSYAY
jgi:multidrug resistance efflux pump